MMVMRSLFGRILPSRRQSHWRPAAPLLDGLSCILPSAETPPRGAVRGGDGVLGGAPVGGNRRLQTPSKPYTSCYYYRQRRSFRPRSASRKREPLVPQAEAFRNHLSTVSARPAKSGVTLPAEKDDKIRSRTKSSRSGRSKRTFEWLVKKKNSFTAELIVLKQCAKLESQHLRKLWQDFPSYDPNGQPQCGGYTKTHGGDLLRLCRYAETGVGSRCVAHSLDPSCSVLYYTLYHESDISNTCGRVLPTICTHGIHHHRHTMRSTRGSAPKQPTCEHLCRCVPFAYAGQLCQLIDIPRKITFGGRKELLDRKLIAAMRRTIDHWRGLGVLELPGR